MCDEEAGPAAPGARAWSGRRWRAKQGKGWKEGRVNGGWERGRRRWITPFHGRDNPGKIRRPAAREVEAWSREKVHDCSGSEEVGGEWRPEPNRDRTEDITSSADQTARGIAGDVALSGARA